ncbi:MAG TPA: VanZ family protein [Anaerolineales bacterium]
MQTGKVILSRWVPVMVWMAAIFMASATPSRELPNFGSLDFVAKKAGHAIGYALLALLIRRALGRGAKAGAGSWVIAVLYALLDEFHQSFVPGRHPSLVDAFLFDGGGAALALLLSWRLWPAQRASASEPPKLV